MTHLPPCRGPQQARETGSAPACGPNSAPVTPAPHGPLRGAQDLEFARHPQPSPERPEMTQPREHCGELPPDIGLIRTVPAGECVLRPGHFGSHAAENGMRWTLAAPPPSPLRERYAAAIASYDHAVGHATNPAPGDHHHGQADAVMAVRDQELEQLRAQLARVRQLAERWENALAPDLAYARALRRALDPQEQS